MGTLRACRSRMSSSAATAPVAGAVRCRPGVLLAAIGSLLAAGANAQSLTVSPVNIDVPAGQSTVAITVTNNGDAASSFQIRPFAWSQDGSGSDVLAATDEVLVSPPLGKIAAAASQTVRLKLRRQPDTKELSYRIVLDQLPVAPASDGTRLVLRFSIPVFAAPAAHAEPMVGWHVETRNGQTFLVAINQGAKHAKYWNMAIAAAGGGNVEINAGGPQYVLAGATQRWRMTAGKGGPLAAKTYTLTARTDRGAIKETVGVNDGK